MENMAGPHLGQKELGRSEVLSGSVCCTTQLLHKQLLKTHTVP